MRARRTGRTPQERLGEKLAEAVRNSLNLPELQVSVRRIPSHQSWGFRLQKNGARSEWIELDAGAVAIIRKIGLLPAIHLGTFRLAYDALRQATERGKPQTGVRREELGGRESRSLGFARDDIF